MNVVDDFVNKGICPYCGSKLIANGFDFDCPNNCGHFKFIDSFADGYYFPRDFKKTDFCMLNPPQTKERK